MILVPIIKARGIGIGLPTSVPGVLAMNICSPELWYGAGSEPSRYLLRRQFQTPLTGKGGPVMKKLLIAAVVAFLGFIVFTSDANAGVCARGVYRAGCAGPRGAVSSGMARTYRDPYYRRGLVVRPYYRRGVVVRRRYR